MAPRPLTSTERAVLFRMRNMRNADMRHLSSTGITRAQLNDLARRGWIHETINTPSRVAWGLTDKGRIWVDDQLDKRR